MRCFIAAALPRRIKEELADLQKNVLNDALVCTPVTKDAMHLTFAFLGDVKEEQITKIKNALDLVRFTPIDTAILKIGTFVQRKRTRTIWAGLTNEKEITNLALQIHAVIRPLGFKLDHAFTSHITLCRVKKVKDEMALRKKITALRASGKPFTISSFTLFSSKLTQKGPIYTALTEFKAT